MTPLQVEILLWYHARACDYRDGDFTAPAVREAIDHFRDRTDTLKENPHTNEPGIYQTYRLTDRGEAFIKAILELPYPVCRWEVPHHTPTGTTP